MTIGEKIKKIRQDLKMSQEAFGQSLGVSRDVVNNMERDRVDVKEHIIRLICKTHRVNYFWLKDDKGDPFLGVPNVLMDDVVEKYNLDDLDQTIIEEYVKLDPEMRNAIKILIKNILKKAPE